jgi:hypothetical protein
MTRMTDLFGTLKRLTPIIVALSFVLTPLAAHAEGTDLTLGSGAPPKSLIGPPSLGAPIGKFSGALLLALDLPPSGYSAGPRFTAEAMYALSDLAPQLRLDVGGRVSYAYHSLSGVSGSAHYLDFVPDAKLRYGVSDLFGVYGDFGFGLAYVGGDVNTGVALAIQLGAGVVYAITPAMNLLGEVRFNIYSKDGTNTFIALPTIGLEFH